MHALIVDDSRAMRMILKKILSGIGFDQLSEAGNGVEALEQLDIIGLPDLMLVDWNMPVMNGLELIRAVRADATRRDIPILMVTTETESSQIVRALAAGASEYLMKPFMAEAISDKLELLGISV
jgi:two-component system chemotaxis response regulator CheY